MFNTAYGDNALRRKTTILEWIKRFNEGHEDYKEQHEISKSLHLK